MNGWLWAAVALTVVVGIAHSVLGERYILIRLLRRSDLPQLFGSDDFTKRTLRFAWHLTTIAWWGMAGVLFLLAEGASAQTAARALALTALLSGIITLVVSRGRHLAWIAFFALFAAIWLGVAPG